MTLNNKMQINKFKLWVGVSRVRHPSLLPHIPTLPQFLFRSLPCCVDNRRRIVFETESETERMTNIPQEFTV